MPQLSQPADRLQPAEDLLDQLPLPLTDLVAALERGPNVDSAVRDLPRDVRGHVEGAQFVDEARHVVALVGAYRAARWRARLQHPRRGVAFGRSCRRGHAHVRNEAVPVVEQNMAQVRQGRLASQTLPVQPRLRVRRRLVGVVPSTFAPEVDRGIPGVIRRRPRRALARPEALQARPSLVELRPVHGEVLVREQAGGAGSVADRVEKGRSHVAAQQPVAQQR